MNSHSPPLSWAAIGSVLVIVVTGIVTNGPTPASLRPLSSTQPPETFNSPGKIPARLWQDPIEVGWNQIQQTKALHKDKAVEQLKLQWLGAYELIKSTSGSTTDSSVLKNLVLQHALDKLKANQTTWRPNWSTDKRESLEELSDRLVEWVKKNHPPKEKEQPSLKKVFDELEISASTETKLSADNLKAAALFHYFSNQVRSEVTPTIGEEALTKAAQDNLSQTASTTPLDQASVGANEIVKAAKKVIEKLNAATTDQIIDSLATELKCVRQDPSPLEEQAKILLPSYQNQVQDAKDAQRRNIGVVLPIVITGLLDADQREIRLRSRYALQEAMEQCNYRSLSASDLGYFPVALSTDTKLDTLGKIQNFGTVESGAQTKQPDEKNKATQAQGVRATDFLPVTFEVFEKTSTDPKVPDENQRICVLWMDHRILGPLDSPRYQNVTTVASIVAKGATLSDIITLSPSEELKALLEDTKATIPEGNNTGKKVTLHYARSTWLQRNTVGIPEDKTANIERIIPVDEYSLRALIGELALRSPSLGRVLNTKTSNTEPVPTPPPEVWLFKEQDTLYSAAMDDTFRALVEKHWKVESFEYLRGLDGGMSPESSADRSKSGTPAQQLLETFGKTIFAPGADTTVGFDQRQVDYMERMADSLLKHQREIKPYNDRVRAIGILGSDVYDKLVVLQILKKRFPSALFFTTDLDAIYLHPGLRGVTQNLLVGSAYGLQNHVVDNGKACFRQARLRDCFQTAFIQCLRKVVSEEILSPPVVRVYEVGRQAFYPTDSSESPMSSEDTWLPTQTLSADWYRKSFTVSEFQDARPAENFDSLPTNLVRQSLAWIGLQPYSAYITFPLLIALSLFGGVVIALAVQPKLRKNAIWLVCAMCNRLNKAFCNRLNKAFCTFQSYLLKALSPFLPIWRGPLGSALIAVILVAMVPVVVGLFSVISPCIFGGTTSAEPFSLFEGISIWPSILVRLLALGIVCFLISQSMAAVLGKKEALPDHADTNRFKESLDTAPHTAVGIALLGVVATGIIHASCEKIGDPFLTPARGYAAFLSHELTMFPCIAALLFATAWSYVVHFHTERLLKTLATQKGVDSPLNDQTAKALIGVSQPVANSVFPPFALMVLLLASRHQVFDGWNIPTSLLATQGGLLFIVLLTSFLLSRAAWQLRRSEQRKLTRVNLSEEKKAEMNKQDIWETATGPFAHLQSQPLMQALLLVLAGIGLNVAEPLLKFFGM